jgi:predicted MFS family arabinose efflux permease
MSGYREFRRGWSVVLSSTVGVALGLSPVPFYTIGVFAPELAREFHWKQATIMGGLLVMTLAVILVGPLTGWLADRYGVRRVTLASVALFGLAVTAFSLQDGSLLLYYSTWGLAAVLGSGTLPVTWTRAINLWFDERKGLALGLTLTGTGVAGFLLKPYTAAAITQFGWRGAYVALGILPLVISLPLALLCFREPPAVEVAIGARALPAVGIPFRDAVRDWRFWLIGIAFVPISFGVGGPIPNMETMLATHGLRHDQILAIVPFIGLFVIVGRLAGGWLIDRIWAPLIAVLLLSLPAVAAVVMARGPVTPATALLSIAALGMAAGVEYDILAFLTARYFGTLNYSAIYGALYGFFALGAGTGPIVYGRVYDLTRSFDGVALAGGVLMALGAVLLLGLGRYRFAAHELPPGQGAPGLRER